MGLDQQTARRAALVQQLVEWRRPASVLIEELRAFPWDCDRPLYTLTCSHMAAALDRYLTGACTSQELADWAEAIEQRADISLDPDHGDVLKQMIVDITVADAVRGEHGLTHSLAAALRQSLAHP